MLYCECPICYELIGDTNTTTTSCGHKFHTSCLLNSIINVNYLCPCCRNPLTAIKQRVLTITETRPDNIDYNIRVISSYIVLGIVTLIVVLDFLSSHPLMREHMKEHNTNT